MNLEDQGLVFLCVGTLKIVAFTFSSHSSEGGAGLLWALAGKPVVSSEPAGKRDGSTEGGRIGVLGLYRLYRPNPHPYFRLAETFYSVQGKVL